MDIVIPYCRSQSDELIYTLRGLKNIPHDKVIIIGDKSDYRGLTHIPYKNTHDIVQNTYNVLMTAANSPDVSDDFIWWHDDMMLLSPIKELSVYHMGSYDKLLEKLPRFNFYTQMKRKTCDTLKKEGVDDPLFFDVHYPFVFNKQKVQAIQDKLHGVNKISFYANYYGINGEYIDKDFKVRRDEDFNTSFISTYDPIFNRSRAGEHIREKLSEVSEYEKGRLVVYDHQEPSWNRRYSSLGRENGAATYSREIEQYHIPIWDKLTNGRDITISTTNYLSKIKDVKLGDLNVQYLHTYLYDNPTKLLRDAKGDISEKVIFVTAYKEMAKYANTIFIPMAIDSEKVALHNISESKHDKRVIWFGNILNRVKMFEYVKDALNRNGYELDVISENRFNGGDKMTQEQCWQKLSEYKYGVGVGRSALEMGALGIKVLFAGSHFGGIITNEKHFQKKMDGNFAFNTCTFSKDIDKCIRNLDKAIVNTNDIKDSLSAVEETIKAAL